MCFQNVKSIQNTNFTLHKILLEDGTLFPHHLWLPLLFKELSGCSRDSNLQSKHSFSAPLGRCLLACEICHLVYQKNLEWGQLDSKLHTQLCCSATSCCWQEHERHKIIGQREAGTQRKCWVLLGHECHRQWLPSSIFLLLLLKNGIEYLGWHF